MCYTVDLLFFSGATCAIYNFFTRYWLDPSKELCTFRGLPTTHMTDSQASIMTARICLELAKASLRNASRTGLDAVQLQKRVTACEAELSKAISAHLALRK